jgi:hypothetical protein
MIEKLESIFKKKYDELKNKATDDDFWVDYCDRQKIKIMHPEWVKESFNEERKGMLCIYSPENSWWLLVPKKFAEKVLVLGYLP